MGWAPFPGAGIPQGSGKEDYSAVFGQCLTELAGQDRRVCAVTAAMQSGTGLTALPRPIPTGSMTWVLPRAMRWPCAGMAKQGLLPVFAVYSTFLQRSYDMLLHDVALQQLHVVLGVDRAGLVGGRTERPIRESLIWLFVHRPPYDGALPPTIRSCGMLRSALL